VEILVSDVRYDVGACRHSLASTTQLFGLSSPNSRKVLYSVILSDQNGTRNVSPSSPRSGRGHLC
jgi:hypothetical protein